MNIEEEKKEEKVDLIAYDDSLNNPFMWLTVFSTKMEERLDALERVKTAIKERCDRMDCPRILKDIASFFQQDEYLYFDGVMLWFNTYHQVSGFMDKTWYVFALHQFKYLQNWFNGEMNCDPGFSQENFCIYFRALEENELFLR